MSEFSQKEDTKVIFFSNMENQIRGDKRFSIRNCRLIFIIKKLVWRLVLKYLLMRYANRVFQ